MENDMKKDTDIGRRLGMLNHLILRSMEKDFQSELMRISAANGYVLFYLHEHREDDVFQKDFEENFGITRSTASKIISLMETKGLVARASVAGDARLKKITLTETGEQMRKNMIAAKDKMERQLTAGFSAEEIQQLAEFLLRMKDNLSV